MIELFGRDDCYDFAASFMHLIKAIPGSLLTDCLEQLNDEWKIERWNRAIRDSRGFRICDPKRPKPDSPFNNPNPTMNVNLLADMNWESKLNHAMRVIDFNELIEADYGPGLSELVLVTICRDPVHEAAAGRQCVTFPARQAEKLTPSGHCRSNRAMT